MDRVKTILHAYESRYSLSNELRADLEDRMEHIVYEILKEWAESIPEAMLELYGPQLINLKAFCMTRRPKCCCIYTVLQEINVLYNSDFFIDISIKLTATSVIVTDLQYSTQERTYPLTWSSNIPSIPRYTTPVEKLEAYNQFLSSSSTYLLVITHSTIHVQALLEKRTPTPVIIHCMIQGQQSKILDTDVGPSSIYDEPLPIKHIIHRTVYDTFLERILVTEGSNATIIEFL